MNTRTNSRSGAARVFSWVLALALIFSLAAAPAAYADNGTYSAEIVLSAEGVDISGKLVLDTNQILLGLLGAVSSQGQTLLDASAYLSTEALAVDSILLNGAYGLNLPNLAQNLENSIFAPNSGSAYALDEVSYQQVMDILSGKVLESVPMPVMDTSAAEEAAAVLMEAYSGVFEQIVPLMTIESSNTSVTVNGKPIQVQQIRCTADANTAVSITELLLQPIQENPQAQDALAVLIDLFGTSAQQDLGATGEEIVQALVQELPGELEQARQELAGSGFSVSSVICASTETQMPVKFALEMEAQGEAVALNLLMSDTLDYFAFELVEDGQTTGVISLEIQENSDSALVFVFNVEENGAITANLGFELNKAAKTFALTASSDGESHSMSGYYAISDSLFSLTWDKVDGQDMGGTITLNLRSEDYVSMPSFTEVATMSESEFTALVQQCSEAAQSLSEMFG